MRDYINFLWCVFAFLTGGMFYGITLYFSEKFEEKGRKMSRKEKMSRAGEFEYKGWIIIIDDHGEVMAFDTDFDRYYFATEQEAVDFIDTVERIGGD